MNTDDLIIDCFAGGGGASTGIEAALGRPIDIAVNHDPDAILMHKTNHPNTLHLTEDIFKVDLEKYTQGRRVRLCGLLLTVQATVKPKAVNRVRRGLGYFRGRYSNTPKP